MDYLYRARLEAPGERRPKGPVYGARTRYGETEPPAPVTRAASASVVRASSAMGTLVLFPSRVGVPLPKLPGPAPRAARDNPARLASERGRKGVATPSDVDPAGGVGAETRRVSTTPGALTARAPRARRRAVRVMAPPVAPPASPRAAP